MTQPCPVSSWTAASHWPQTSASSTVGASKTGDCQLHLETSRYSQSILGCGRIGKDRISIHKSTWLLWLLQRSWLQEALSSIVLSVCQEKLWQHCPSLPHISMEVTAARSGASAVVQSGLKAMYEMIWHYQLLRIKIFEFHSLVLLSQLGIIFNPDIFLADPGKSRGGPTNTIVICWRTLFLPWFYSAA